MAILATKSEIDQAFRDWLRAYMREHDLNQPRAAVFWEVAQATIHNLLSGKKKASESMMDKMAARAGTTVGEALIPFVDERALVPPEPRALTPEELAERGFFTVPFSDHMKLAAGRGGSIPVTDDQETSQVIVHGPSLGRRSARQLQAFRVGGDSMEPLLAEGGIVLADLRHNELRQIKEGSVYILCWDFADGECAVKRLRWADQGRILAVESENPAYPARFMNVSDVQLVGRVIWAWREID
ncbi:MAG: hypothetical protein LBP55_05185 [Candidatus Adiutrix sp.]|jgi:SOS-response transcriptional repressor LexA|nr:hypothetical protein [Candidatus Adiutrix sp.]